MWRHRQARLDSLQDLGQVGRQILCHFKIATVPGSAVLAMDFHSTLLPPHGDTAHFGRCHL